MTYSTNVSLAVLPSHECRTTVDGYSYDTLARPRRYQNRSEGAHTDSLTTAHQVRYHFVGYTLVKMSLALVDHHHPIVNGDGLVKKLVNPLGNKQNVTKYQEATCDTVNSQVPRSVTWSLHKETIGSLRHQTRSE